MRKITLLLAPILIAPLLALGAGYQLNLQGLRQLAMGGSGTAWPWDVSTLFYNPGGLSRLNGVQAYASAQFIMPSTEYAQMPTGSYTANTQSQTFTTFNFYVGGPIQKGSKVGLGIGVYEPFGNGLTWDNDWSGRFIIQKIYLQTIFIQPTVSYKFNDHISAGIGFVYAMGNVDLKQAMPVQDQTGAYGQAELKGDGNGIGFNAGVQIKATEKLQFGITYRSKVNMKLDGGNANFTVPFTLSSEFPSTTFSSNLPLPSVLSVGIGYKVNKHLTVQADANYISWSAFDSLKFDYAKTTFSLSNTHIPFNYQNTVTIRVGGSYSIGRSLCIMAGAAWDPTPVKDGYVTPVLPDANRTILTCGLSYKPVEKLTILAALEYVSSAKRDGTYDYANFSGKYQTKAATPGIGLTYNF